MPLGAVMAALWSIDPWLAIPGLIPLVMAQRSFKAVANWQEQSRRSSELASEAQQLAAELQQKQDELIRSSKLAALGTFSAGIGHEFNNLLAGIMGFAQIGLQSSSVDDKNEALDVAVRACLRGRSITGGLLTFARRDEAQRGLHLLQNIVDETLLMVERELAKLNITIQRRFTPVMPTVCDAGQISQVVLNLLTNARDAMADTGGGIITIDLGQQGEWIELVVSDTGSGIPAELIDQVFQPFMTTKGALGGSTTPGTGLGLAICHGIIQSHGGEIGISSVLERGTSVTLRLPLTREEADQSEAGASGAPLAPLRILVVDDDEVVAQGIARLLRGSGHSSAVAGSGQQALLRFRQQPFDLVLCDIVMPGMPGIELIRQLRSLDGGIQVLAMTGQAAASQVEQALEAGARAVLSKPFAVEELLAALAGSSTRIAQPAGASSR
jgi:signal transduction histidine kinase/ActR/RegA family two-component response regulator